MSQIYGRLHGGRVVGGVLVPRTTIVGNWAPRDEAFAALAAGSTERVVIPDGGTAAVALVAGQGAAEVTVAPAEIAVRLEAAHPDEVRHDAPWLRRAISAEGLTPVLGNVHWVIAENGRAQAWIPVRIVPHGARRSHARRPRCVG